MTYYFINPGYKKPWKWSNTAVVVVFGVIILLNIVCTIIYRIKQYKKSKKLEKG